MGITGPVAILARPDWGGAVDTGQSGGAVTAMMQLSLLAGGGREVSRRRLPRHAARRVLGAGVVVATPAPAGARVLAGAGRVPGR